MTQGKNERLFQKIGHFQKKSDFFHTSAVADYHYCGVRQIPSGRCLQSASNESKGFFELGVCSIHIKFSSKVQFRIS